MKISVLIPCHNEEQSIAACVQSCLNQTRPFDQILVIDDASTDRSLEILNQFGDKIQVIHLAQNAGNKSYVQQIGLEYVTGDVLVCTDGDTVFDKDFCFQITKSFMENPKVAAVSGYVKSLAHNWMTALRELDYIIGQNFHKKAQNYIGALYVIPGCAAAFKTEVFKKIITFDHDTLTEDLDFTYKFNKLGYKIEFNPKAIVYTQDPATLRDYVNQMRRWYAGGWQNIKKHKSILLSPVNAWDLYLVYIEGFVFALLLFVLPFLSMPFFLRFMASYLIYSAIVAIYSALIRKRTDLFLYGLFYFVLGFINSYIFIEQFIKEVIFKHQNLNWYKVERRAISI